LYPFCQHNRDNNQEYKPEEFGFAGAQDFRGRYRAHEALVFVGYERLHDVATIQRLRHQLAFGTARLANDEDPCGGWAQDLPLNGLPGSEFPYVRRTAESDAA
jgi:hypothetical protein